MFLLGLNTIIINNNGLGGCLRVFSVLLYANRFMLDLGEYNILIITVLTSGDQLFD